MPMEKTRKGVTILLSNKIDLIKKSSLCGSAVMNPTNIHEDACWIPGLSQWVKDLALLLAVVQVEDAPWNLSCCDCGTGRQLQLQSDLQPGNFHVPQVRPYKAKTNKSKSTKKDKEEPYIMKRDEYKRRILHSLTYTQQIQEHLNI